MTEELTITPEEEPLEGEPTPESSGGGKKKLIIIIAIVLLIVGAVSFVLFTSMGQRLIGKGAAKEQEVEKKQETDIEHVQFTTLPELLINLRTSDGRSSFLKASFIIESPSEEVSKKIDKLKPMLADQFQVYLRELDVEDLKGSVGMQRIRQELINRTNLLVEPEKINNVLFSSFLVQ